MFQRPRSTSQNGEDMRLSKTNALPQWTKATCSQVAVGQQVFWRTGKKQVTETYEPMWIPIVIIYKFLPLGKLHLSGMMDFIPFDSFRAEFYYFDLFRASMPFSFTPKRRTSSSQILPRTPVRSAKQPPSGPAGSIPSANSRSSTPRPNDRPRGTPHASANRACELRSVRSMWSQRNPFLSGRGAIIHSTPALRPVARASQGGSEVAGIRVGRKTSNYRSAADVAKRRKRWKELDLSR